MPTSGAAEFLHRAVIAIKRATEVTLNNMLYQCLIIALGLVIVQFSPHTYIRSAITRRTKTMKTLPIADVRMPENILHINLFFSYFDLKCLTSISNIGSNISPHTGRVGTGCGPQPDCVHSPPQTRTGINTR